MPEHDPNGATRRPVLKRVEAATLDEADGPQRLERAALEGKLWVFCGEFEAQAGQKGSEVAADNAHRQHGSGIYLPLGAGSWGRGYWRG